MGLAEWFGRWRNEDPLGPNRPAVDEVIALAISGRLLRPVATVADPGVLVLSDFGMALEWACSQAPEFLSEEEMMRSGWLCWTDLREHRAAEIHARAYADRRRRKAESIAYDSFNQITIGIPHRFEEASNEVEVDLRFCACSRAVCGKELAFWERIFAAYAVGLWPCGWDGCYPGGRLVVFHAEHAPPPARA